MGFIEHLDNDPVRIGTVERGAAVAVHLEGVDDFDAAGAEVFFQLFHSVDRCDDKSQMIQLLFHSARREIP
jgi:hypothetical protein